VAARWAAFGVQGVELFQINHKGMFLAGGVGHAILHMGRLALMGCQKHMFNDDHLFWNSRLFMLHGQWIN
jgi:hypothetical protein